MTNKKFSLYYTDKKHIPVAVINNDKKEISTRNRMFARYSGNSNVCGVIADITEFHKTLINLNNLLQGK